MGLFDKLFRRTDPNAVTVNSPVNGRSFDITEVPDKRFSSRTIGEGIVFFPTEGKIYAPMDGRIDLFFDTAHAFSMVGTNGVEVFIHVGLDTMKLKGTGFRALKETDDEVKKGEVILEFDRLLLEDNGYDETVVMFVMNSEEMSSIRPFTGKVVTPESEALQIEKL